jgi:hypothetical protein
MLLKALKRKGATVADFRRFVSEEMILQALPRAKIEFDKKRGQHHTEAEWLASLRKDAHIEVVRPTPKQ